eukprot:TRINITY_DN3464_c2_g1_i1.p1 TRINITY_DN3464_c2_g1~~TRINITY_DN3464_c2_g1_i1.p1  ORF type:complete len:573 (-),score=104.08 TRINITY_DN3464_c2_g1_i1:44-1762(-)
MEKQDPCELETELFTIVARICLVVACGSMLVMKKRGEDLERTWTEFMLDTSKQIVGMAWLKAIDFAFVSWREAESWENECGWLWANTMVETTIGVLVEYILLNTISFYLERHLGDTQSFLTGEYSDASGIVPKVYFKQLAVWVACVSCMKLVIASELYWCHASVISVAQFFLCIVSWNAEVDLIFVRLLTPVCATVMQCWLTDNFIRKGGVPFTSCWKATNQSMRRVVTAPCGEASLSHRGGLSREATDSFSAQGPRDVLVPRDLGSDGSHAGNGPAFANCQLGSTSLQREDLERHLLPDPRVTHLERQVANERKEREKLLALERRVTEQRLAAERKSAEQRLTEECKAAEEIHKREVKQLRNLASEDAAERQELRKKVVELENDLAKKREALQERMSQMNDQVDRSSSTDARLRAQIARLTAATAAAARAAAVPSAGLTVTHNTYASSSASGSEDCPGLTTSPKSSSEQIVLLSRSDLERLTPAESLQAAAQRSSVLDRKLGALEAKLGDIGIGGFPGDRHHQQQQQQQRQQHSPPKQFHRQGLKDGQAMWDAFQPLLHSSTAANHRPVSM